MRIKLGSKKRYLALRSRVATDTLEGHGEYAIGEAAFVERIGDTNYVTSLGVTARKDHMPTSVRQQRDLERETQEAKKSDDD